jgi:hypothetical protein
MTAFRFKARLLFQRLGQSGVVFQPVETGLEAADVVAVVNDQLVNDGNVAAHARKLFFDHGKPLVVVALMGLNFRHPLAQRPEMIQNDFMRHGLPVRGFNPPLLGNIERNRRGAFHPARGDPPDRRTVANEFAAFAKEYGGLTFREAHAFFAKHEFWEVRNGVSRFPAKPISFHLSRLPVDFTLDLADACPFFDQFFCLIPPEARDHSFVPINSRSARKRGSVTRRAGA